MTPHSTDLAWLAGFMDAESSFGVNRSVKRRTTGKDSIRYRPAIQVSNTHHDSIRTVTEILAAHNIGYTQHFQPARGNNAATWTVSAWSGVRCALWIDLITPYLRVKHMDARLIREFCAFLLAYPNSGCRGRSYSSREREIFRIFGVTEDMAPRPTKGLRLPILTSTGVPFSLLSLGPVDNAWLSGFFDGEGTIKHRDRSRHGSHYMSYEVALTNTNMPVLPYVRAVMDSQGLSYNCYPYLEPSLEAKMKLPFWKIETMGGQRTSAWLSALAPYLYTKRESALDLLAYIKENPGLTWRIDDERRAMARQLYATGQYSVQAVADSIGIGYGTAYRIVHNRRYNE